MACKLTTLDGLSSMLSREKGRGSVWSHACSGSDTRNKGEIVLLTTSESTGFNASTFPPPPPQCASCLCAHRKSTGWIRSAAASLVDADDVADVLVLVLGGVDGLQAPTSCQRNTHPNLVRTAACLFESHTSTQRHTEQALEERFKEYRSC